MADSAREGYIHAMATNIIGCDRKRALKVLKNGTKWRIHSTGSSTLVFQTKMEAVSAAKACLARKGGLISIHSIDGKVTCLTVLGGEAARRLNAIEGMTPDQGSRRLIRQIANKTPKQRREAVFAYFRKGTTV